MEARFGNFWSALLRLKRERSCWWLTGPLLENLKKNLRVFESTNGLFVLVRCRRVLGSDLGVLMNWKGVDDGSENLSPAMDAEILVSLYSKQEVDFCVCLAELDGLDQGGDGTRNNEEALLRGGDQGAWDCGSVCVVTEPVRSRRPRIFELSSFWNLSELKQYYLRAKRFHCYHGLLKNGMGGEMW